MNNQKKNTVHSGKKFTPPEKEDCKKTSNQLARRTKNDENSDVGVKIFTASLLEGFYAVESNPASSDLWKMRCLSFQRAASRQVRPLETSVKPQIS